MTQQALVAPSQFALPPVRFVPSLRGNVVLATLAIGAGFGGFFIWGFTAHLDSAAIASGTVIVDSKAKPVSHLEGGILKRMLVSEGQKVGAGEPLLELDDTKARSDLQQLQSRRIGFMAKIARLRAEQANATGVAFPPELAAGTSTYIQQIIRNEDTLFERRRDTLARTIAAQRKQIDGYSADIDAAQAQIAANTEQQRLLKQQLDAMATLVTKGVAAQTKLIDVQSRYSQLLSQASALTGTKTHAEEGRAQVEVEISKTETAWQSDVADSLQSTLIELNAIEDSISQANDVLQRSVVLSPQAGIVTGIQYLTPGGVIGAGQPILDIVPQDGPRIVEAKLDPRDIDSVRTGAKVQVRLSAYDTKQLAPIDGTLSYVAADLTVNPQTSAAYYVVRATVSADALAKLPKVNLNAGEPADVLILNRPRLAIDYILSPFVDSMHMAFHEQ